MSTIVRYGVALVSLTLGLLGRQPLPAQPPAESPAASSAKQWARAQALIRPGADEAKWLDISWEIDVQQARHKAAAAGKPIFFLTGGGKSPLGDC